MSALCCPFHSGGGSRLYTCSNKSKYAFGPEERRVTVAIEAAAKDPVNAPAHYTATDVEPIKAIEAWGLGFCLGNTVKYIARAGRKDPTKELEDVKKARWYLDRHIANLEGSK